MVGLKEELADIFVAENNSKYKILEGCNKEFYISVNKENFMGIVSSLSDHDFSLITLFCAENFDAMGRFTLFYAFEKRGYEETIVLQHTINDDRAYSIANIFPSACWYEREVRDGFGLEFDAAFDKRRLFLHETYPDDFHPLLKSFRNQRVKTKESINPAEEYKFKEVKGEGVYQIPVGPVHAGIIEPGHFRFSVIGETIFNLEIRMFYKHRGIEKLAEGKQPLDCVSIAESISGDETIANATAFCMAIEKISGITVPVRALYLRTIFLELERIYSYLGDMAGMIIDIAYPLGASPFFILREELFRQNDALAGSRFMKGILTIGGLKKDVSGETLRHLLSYLNDFSKRFNEAIKVSHSSSFSVLDRLETTGIVKKELLKPLNITGPIARAAGSYVDTRVDHPYGIYPQTGLQKRVLERGDVLSRFDLKAAEVMDSIKIIKKMINEMPGGDIIDSSRIKDGYALSLVESARGQNVHWVYIKRGRIDRYKVRTASFCNWQAIEHAVLGNIVPDFPLINKSMNLSYAGTDL